ncbi:MAG: hypothetical protein HRU75_10755 [Planctomycetia bacterium]|nr:MAG: hypothetical protein HRU75_10755 [Planctomycetia bacterium]
MIPRESLGWTRTQAIAKLKDESLRVAAAVRLARIAGASSPALPEPLPRAQALRLRVIDLGTEMFALGEPHPESDRALSHTLVFRADGSLLVPGDLVQAPSSAAGEPLHVSDDDEDRYAARRVNAPERKPGPTAPAASFTLFASDDVEVFPRLLVSATAVFDADAPAAPMLSLAAPASLRFQLVFQRGYPLVVLVPAHGAAEPIARYTWDPFEVSFVGPARDQLSDGTVFALDMDASPALVPVGGLIESPRHDNTPPPATPQPDEQPPY